METNGNISLLVCTQSTTIRSIAYEAEKSELVVTFKGENILDSARGCVGC